MGLLFAVVAALSCTRGRDRSDAHSERANDSLSGRTQHADLEEARSFGGASAERASYFKSIEVYGQRRGNAGVRVVMHFDGEPTFNEQRLPGDDVLPARLMVELPDSTWSEKLDPVVSVGVGGLTRLRLTPSERRAVLDLEPGAEAALFYLTDPYRIIVDVRASGRRAANAKPVILLDPGHGGEEPGAANERYGLVESEVALDLAARTREALYKQLPGAEVLLTRKVDEDMSLEARCGMANALAADVFVSIHLNAGPKSVKRGGITTFVLDSTNDRQALRLAARENGTHSRRVTGVQEIFAKLHRRTQMRGSRRLADRIQRSTLRRARTVLPSITDRGVRSAMFYVLVGATMPAVLVEASFLTVEREAKALTTERYRQRLAEGIASGIVSYLESK